MVAPRDVGPPAKCASLARPAATVKRTTDAGGRGRDRALAAGAIETRARDERRRASERPTSQIKVAHPRRREESPVLTRITRRARRALHDIVTLVATLNQSIAAGPVDVGP
ncbi:MAG: hypothetical protein JNK64_18230 [Myxococcales bacterium]|nr:hypothetical protein [Myxococcales bacterium]